MQTVSANELPLDLRIAQIAARQKDLLRADQLDELGLGPSGVRNRVARGRLHRIHDGVYSLTAPPHRQQQRWLAAVYACGPGALLSDLCAGSLCGLVDHPPLAAQITIASGRGRSRKGIEVHRRGPIDPRDIRRKDAIPCTSADLVLIDLCPHHTEAELETMLVAAESLRLLKRGRLAELIAERHGRPGIRKLATLLALEPAITRSRLELLVLPICREAGLARPRVNYPIPVTGHDKPLIVDFAWPEIRIVVEADSQRFHGDWERAEADRERDQLLALEGWVSHRFVRSRLKHDPSGSARRLRRLTEVRLAELNGRP